MPITLGCPSCGKRFRARDESAGKRVKCPFCQAAVNVPTPEEAAAAGAPTESLQAPASPPPAPRRAASRPDLGLPPIPPDPPPPTPVSAAPADDWGAVEPTPSQPLRLQPVPAVAPTDGRDRPWPHRPAATDDPTYTPSAAKDRPRKGPKPADAEALPGWRAARRGLGRVQAGLFLLAAIGVVPFAKLVYEGAVGELPNGEGWVRIEGYVNTAGPDIIRTTQREEIDAVAYGLPILLGGLLLVIGRVVAGGAPRASGAKGLFFFSGLFTLLALIGALSIPLAEKGGFDEVGRYARTALVLGGALAEFWFLVGLGNAAGAVRRPAAARSVGGFAMLVGLAYLAATVGWEQYVKHGADLGRPKPLTPDWRFGEELARMLGWLLVIGSYWRTTGAVKHAVRLHIEDVQDAAAAANR